ncbi:MAG TPA: signal peptidase I [Enteractinococcus helveticum]|uniref:Signal peptidase I n=1 Tax=Enteractinococcus helveticum TaxID=1837282 RepID=A0A921FM99_9MICC|nr:signal peptidase I [Enteractinococcus helveticum]HJF13857.1 signal peptidase I [Enteractinococcus helveticum]
METRSDTPRHSHRQPDRTARAKDPGVLHGVISGMTTVALVGLLLLVAAVVVVPKLMGGAGLTVLSGSMEPTYSPGDMVVSVPQDSYAIGDVVTFQPVSGDPTLVTHRIVAHRTGQHGVSYVTRGDANSQDDNPIIAEQVMGKVIYHVPYVGHVSNLVGQHRSTIVVLVAIGLFGYAAYAISSGVRAARRQQGSEDHGLIAS